MKPKAVLAYCRERGIKAVDLRFVDVRGYWRHVTFPVSALTESAFEEGFGQDIPYSSLPSNNGQHCILVPISQANYLDPFTAQPTLVLIASVQDSLMREESPFDPRCVAKRAISYLQSTSIGEDVISRSSCQFNINRVGVNATIDNRRGASSFLACGPNDPDFEFRCEVANLAAECGLQIDRHFRGERASTEMTLRPASLLEACDDLMMLRYLVAQHAHKQHLHTDLGCMWAITQWQITLEGESIFAGSAYRGLSEHGVHAVAGILKHSRSIAAIGVSGNHDCDSVGKYPWRSFCSLTNPEAVCSVSAASNSSHSKGVEYRGMPANANPYLVYSAVLSAMIDGIQNKTSPGTSLDPGLNASLNSDYHIASENSETIDLQSLATTLNADREFLTRGDVFADELIDTIVASLN